MTLSRNGFSVLFALALMAPAVFAQAMVDGEVKKIDKAQSRITLAHGEIRNLDVPAMTMAFRIKDAAWLDKVQVGDRVKFSAEKIAGQYTVTVIQKAP